MKYFFYVVLMLLPVSYLQAAEIAVTMHSLNNNGPGKSIGVIVVKETPQGLRFQPHLQNMEPGNYMFTVNENVGCGSKYTQTGINIPGMAAGDSISELPSLKVNSRGIADEWVTAEDLTMRDIRGRTLVISMQTKPSFNIAEGTEDRVACGSLELYK